MWYDEAIFYQFYPLGICGCEKENTFDYNSWNGAKEPVSRNSNTNIFRMTNWIQHLKKLGMNAVYFSPICQSDRHGYDTRDYYTIDSRLGSNQDFADLCNEFHKNGIRIVLDGVFNHVGRGFWAFRDVQQNRQNSAYKDWFYINWNKNSNNNDGFWYEGWEGHFDLVKLNLQNPAVQEHLFGAIQKWKDLFNIDGLRLDVAYCLDREFLKKLRNFCNTLSDGLTNTIGDFFLLGETIYSKDMDIVNNEMLNSCTNYEIYKGLHSSFNSKNMFEISYSLNRQFGKDGIFRGKHLFNFLDNHDVERIRSLISNSQILPLIYTTLFTIPGIPCVYYGSEWELEGKKSNGDDCLRPYIQNPEWNELTNLISKLTKIHSEEKTLSYGDFENLFITNEQFCYKRTYQNSETNKKEEIIIALNLSCSDYTINKKESGYAAFSGIHGNWKDLLSNETLYFSGNINLQPQSIKILKLVD